MSGMSAPVAAVEQTSAATPAALLICEQCDTVYRRRPLARGETARCARCHAVLERHQRMGTNTMLALILTAMLVFVGRTCGRSSPWG
jgi:paraquat-inducible protein A